LQNAGFESSTAGQSWQIDKDDAKQSFSINVDAGGAKEGRQSLVISAEQPVHLTLRQELFLPIGTLWRLTGWVKSEAPPIGSSPSPKIGIEAQVGDQGFSDAVASGKNWQQESFLFRVPSPGRITVALNAFNNQAGKAWLDDIRLEPVPEPLKTE